MLQKARALTRIRWTFSVISSWKRCSPDRTIEALQAAQELAAKQSRNWTTDTWSASVMLQQKQVPGGEPHSRGLCCAAPAGSEGISGIGDGIPELVALSGGQAGPGIDRWQLNPNLAEKPNFS